MHPESEYDEIVLFDTPPAHADELWIRLQASRLTWVHRTDDRLFVVTALRAEPSDLARLLRDVQAWLADSGLLYLTFLLDGREYELQARAEALADRAA